MIFVSATPGDFEREHSPENINKAIKKLDNVSSPDVRKAIKILRQDDILKHTNEGEINDKETAIDTSIGVIDTNEAS